MRVIALLLVILAALVHSSAAHAHASLIRSEPPDRAVVAQAPTEIRLTFNEPVSPLVMRLVNPGGAIIELKATQSTDGETIVLPLPVGSSPGTHLLSWRVVSADGHPVGGSVTFSIGHPSATPSAPQSSEIRLRAAIWLTRLVLYLGLFVGIGGAFFLTWIAAEQSGSPRVVATVALVCGLIAAVLSAGLHGVDLLGPELASIRETRIWGRGLASPYGWTLGIAALSLVLALTALARQGAAARWCAAFSVIGVGAALAASGHAATAGPETVTRPAVFVHAVCVTFWIGSLLPLAAMLRNDRDRIGLARFSKAIPLPFSLLLATGVLLAIFQVRQFEAVWTTSYGIILSCKLAAACVLLGLAGVNRRLTPRVMQDDAGATLQLRQSILCEIAIMALILGLVASWRFTPPPRAILATAAEPIHAHIHTDRAMADLQIEKSGDGGRRIKVVLLNDQFGPLTAKEVTIALTKPDAGLEPLRLPAKHQDGNTWQVDELHLPIPGQWRIRVEILITDFDKVIIEDVVNVSP
jgi:copper transport protein